MASSTNQYDSSCSAADPRFQSALEQFHEDARLYNRAVGSYNTHLSNHRERRGLHDIPFREPVSAHDDFDAALRGETEAAERVLTDLIDEAHLDSQLRRHPRTYPIHVEAVEQLEMARDQLVTTLEEALYRFQETDGASAQH